MKLYLKCFYLFTIRESNGKGALLISWNSRVSILGQWFSKCLDHLETCQDLWGQASNL